MISEMVKYKGDANIIIGYATCSREASNSSA